MPPPPPPRPPREPTGKIQTAAAQMAGPGAGTTTASTRAKILLAREALELRDEQLQAQVKYFGADLETNAELDKITEQVVAELRLLKTPEPTEDRSEHVEIELIGNLRTLLEKLFSPKRATFLQRKIEEVQRRITQLFFESELYARIAAGNDEVGAASWHEQALYVALKRHEEAIISELDAIPVTDDEVRDRAKARVQQFIKQLASDFLSRTTPELERLLTIYREVLVEFFAGEFPTSLGEFAWEVIRESRVAQGHKLGYKLTADKFGQFREVFDRKFIEKLVFHIEDPIARRAIDDSESFREATLRFVTEPRIHTEICSVMNDAIYDYLHGEGFLDLPPNWRRILNVQARRAAT